jgi:hypothetical protein
MSTLPAVIANIQPQSGVTREFIVKMSNFHQLTDAVKKEMRKALKKAGENMKREVVKLLLFPPKTGRTYPLRGATHQASGPWEAPANRTGKLIQSLYSEVRSATELELGETEPYAFYLEEGTHKKDGSVLMAPRPHVYKVAKKYEEKLGNLITEALDAAFPI